MLSDNTPPPCQCKSALFLIFFLSKPTDLVVTNDKVVFIFSGLLLLWGRSQKTAEYQLRLKPDWYFLYIFVPSSPCLEKSVCFTESLAISAVQKKANDPVENENWEYTLHMAVFPENVLRTQCLLMPHFEEAAAEGPHLPLHWGLSQCNPARESNTALKASVTPSHLLAAGCFLRESNLDGAPCLIKDGQDWLRYPLERTF